MLTILYIFLAVAFLALNAFFVLSEFAIVKIRDTRLEELENHGSRKAPIARKIVKDLEAYLATCQLGITIASLGLGWAGEPLVAHITAPLLDNAGMTITPALSRTISIIVAFVFTTAFHVVLGEQVPKNISIRIPERAVLFVAKPLSIFHTVFYPTMWVLNELTLLILKILKIKQNVKESIHTDEELRMILGESQEYGRISLGRLVMFEHLFDFGKTEVREVMTPLSRIAFLNPAATWQETRAVIKERRFSRYPLIAPDSIRHYYVHLKDIVSILDAESFAPNDKPEFNDIRRPLYEIQETMPIEKALKIFQEKKLQLALVRDSKGEITGLLSMEDIVEELTGEIRDEFDTPPVITLSSLFHQESCIMDLKAKKKQDAMIELIRHLHKENPEFDLNEAITEVLKRERSVSTVIAPRIACPHGRLKSINRAIIAVGRSHKGIVFSKTTGTNVKPAKIIVLMLTPANQPPLQLAIWQELVGLMKNKTLYKRLLAAKSPDAIYDVFCTFEDKVMEITDVKESDTNAEDSEKKPAEKILMPIKKAFPLKSKGLPVARQNKKIPVEKNSQ